jgi:hypothetical protein
MAPDFQEEFGCKMNGSALTDPYSLPVAIKHMNSQASKTYKTFKQSSMTVTHSFTMSALKTFINQSLSSAHLDTYLLQNDM